MRVSLCIIAAVSASLVTSCTHSQSSDQKVVYQEKKNNLTASDKKIIPLTEQHFSEAAGWLDNETILYTTNDPIKGSKINDYNIFKGKGKTIYTTDDRLISAELNQKQDMILVQTLENGSKIKLTLINLKGDMLFTKSFDSHELQVDWNQFNPYLLYVTEFTKDWGYDSYLVDVKDHKVEKNIAQAAFVHWTSSETFEYIKWDDGDREKPAPVYSYEINSKHEKKVADDALFLDVFQNIRLIVKSVPEESAEGIYLFSDVSSMKKQISLKLPLYSAYSSLSSMEYTYDQKNKVLYTYEQNQSGSLFDLIAIHLQSGKRKVICKRVEMHPLTLSPDGNHILYGYTKNQVISISSKKLEPFVIEE
ncbi:hypothetical protein PJ311_10060 [Bacillus sp. CLL-7-23]|uniref:YqgU-like 6-bladed beta-propeller domain-containing protein n=1 Tax=Bacillus changyiensis TaxID=3004103 RepID=A0ABT4X3T2_9BACI|nr:hypothetical protein [Bacillus changyiensis]MDA7026951.1 hypothetical protein [Bacillus changyiensis]